MTGPAPGDPGDLQRRRPQGWNIEQLIMDWQTVLPAGLGTFLSSPRRRSSSAVRAWPREPGSRQATFLAVCWWGAKGFAPPPPPPVLLLP